MPRISDRDLAEHWGCSRPYLTKLRQTKAMPGFPSLAEADSWRALNAPPRGRRVGGKNRDEHAPQPPTDEGGGAATEGAGESSSANTPSGGGAVIDIKRYIRRRPDFDGYALEAAERVYQVAVGLYERAAQGGDPVAVAAALKNYNEAAKACAAAREKFLETRERARILLSLDEVENVVGTELQELRNALLKFGERAASALVGTLNAEQLAIVRTTVDAGVDEIFRKTEVVADRPRRELAS